MIRQVFFSLFLTAALLLSACQQAQTPAALPPPLTATRAPTASQTPSPTARTPTPSGGTRTQAAWTATFQAFTQAAVAAQTRAAQTGTAVAQTAAVEEAARLTGYPLTETAVIHTLLTTITPQVTQSLRSPDGKWLEEITRRGCVQLRTDPGSWPDAYEALTIGDQQVETQYHYCGGMGAYGLEAKFWTPDSRFFYYTKAREGWPDGGYPWRRPISRYDTVSGKSETLYEAVFSPDQRRVAGSDGTDLVVWEVGSDTVRRFSGLADKSTAYRAIWAAWSPDGRGLAYLTQTFCQDTYPCPTTLNRVDTQTWQQTPLLDLSAQPMLTVEWPKADTLALWGADFTSNWVYDLKKNTLSRVSPTPTPTP